MREFDEMRALQAERDGIRTISGHHIGPVESPCAACGEPARGRYCVPCARLLTDLLRTSGLED